ncbi:MAG: aminodeoxychorismate/anthranilate synthase component II [Gammaproteobacteria bacterium]
MILLIDNWDSFVFNLARYFGELGCDRQVIRTDAITLEQIEALRPSHIVLSPGPCAPKDAGISLEVIKYFAGRIPLLGVCLGHQAIGEAFGGRVVRSNHPMHGKSSVIEHDGSGIFRQLPNPLRVARYHSLIVEPESLPVELRITAQSDKGEIMALEHQKWPIFGVQFHPESVLTESGHALLQNFISR